MKITQIKLQNFGPFYGDHQLDFPSDQEGVYIIHGDTGQGKTSLLRSIFWGFYGKAYGRSNDEIPPTSLLNWTALDEENYTFSVAITFLHEGKKWVLTRKMSANQHSDHSYNQNISCFLVRDDEPIANNPLKVRLEIEKIIPFDVSRFFFFDGEMLVKYEELLDQNSRSMRIMKESIEHILGIPYLRTARDDLDEVKKRIERDIARLVKKLGGANYSELAETYQDLNEEIERKRGVISTLQSQRITLEEEINEKKRALTKMKAVKENATKRKELDSEIANLELKTISQRERLYDLNSKLYKTVLSRIADDMIEQLRSKQSKVMEKFLKREGLIAQKKKIEQGIAKSRCEYCRTILDPVKLSELEREKESLKAEIDELKEIPQPNLVYGTSANYLENIKIATISPEEYEKIDSEIQRLDYDIAAKRAALKQIEQLLINVDEKEPFLLERQIQAGLEELGRLRGEQESLENLLNQDLSLHSELNQRLASIDRAELNILTDRVKYIGCLLEIFEEAINTFRNERRKEVERQATEIFKTLILKPEFKGLRIDENFGLSIITEGGKVINKAEWRSAGEEQIVAMSLIGALNKCSKIHAPIFMDAPLIRIDIPHGQNILRYIPSMADEVVVFVTDREYRKEDEDILREKIVTEYRIKHESEEIGSRIINLC
jgi:DNA sulfur modification protein DndD